MCRRNERVGWESTLKREDVCNIVHACARLETLYTCAVYKNKAADKKYKTADICGGVRSRNGREHRRLRLIAMKADASYLARACTP